MKTTLASAAVLGLCVSALTACGGAASSQDADTIKVGVIVSESGSGVSIGADEAKGYKAALKAINASGGVDGKKLSFITVDDKSEDATAVLNFRKLATDDHVVAVLGPGGASTAAAAASVADSLKVPEIAFPSNKGETWEGPDVSEWAFGVAASGTSMGHGCLSKYLDLQKAKDRKSVV